MGPRAFSRLAAAVVLTAAVGTPVLTSAPAQAASCSGSSGVTVVVDFQQLGGGVQQQCARDGGSAASMFGSTGFTLDRVQSQQGFICRVAGAPADDPCVEPNGAAYWSLWWNDGRGGAWIYATTGADGLKVSPGGSVAFSWNQGGGRVAPSAGPDARLTATPMPSPTAPEPSEAPKAAGTQGGGDTVKAPSGTRTTKPRRPNGSSATPADTPTVRPTPTPSGSTKAPLSPAASVSPSTGNPATPRAEPTQSDDSAPAAVVPPDAATTAGASPSSETEIAIDTDDTVPTSSPAATADGGLPPWVAPVLVVLLFGAAGVAAVARRRGARATR